MDWKELLVSAMGVLSDPVIMGYVVTFIVTAIVSFRGKLSERNAMLVDLVIYAFGKVEKAASLLPAAKREKYNKEIEFAKLVAKKYEERTGSAIDEKTLAALVTKAATLALQKKLHL